MIYHVVVLGPHSSANDRTDMTTRSLYEATYRRGVLHSRLLPVEVRTGSGRLVVDIRGEQQR